MFNTNILERMSILFFIAIFSFAVIIACSQDTTEPSRSNSSTLVPDNTGPVMPMEPLDTDLPSWTLEYETELPKPEPTKPTFDANSYYSLYVPWVKWREGEGWITNVSWQDTNTLTKLWKEQIDGGKHNNGKRWFIRNGDNNESDYRVGSYYYFDKNFDIVDAGRYENKLKLKQFLGGVIVKYSGGRSPGTWTIGGLYKYLLNKVENNSQGQQGYTKYNDVNLNEFMRASHNWGEGDLTIILMNVASGDDQYQNEFGIDEYYSTSDYNYRKNPTYFLGKNPTTYLGTSQNGWSGAKLNVRINHSRDYNRTTIKWLEKLYYFRFVESVPYAWQLE